MVGQSLLSWSIALEGKDDLRRFKALNWGLRTWDLWNWNDYDKRFGDDWPARHRTRLSEKCRDKRKTCSGKAGGPGRIPAQMIAHILYYFSDQGDLVFDPMVGGGVVSDTCLVFNGQCWSFNEGHELRRPEADFLRDKIYELRVALRGIQYRMLYFFHTNE